MASKDTEAANFKSAEDLRRWYEENKTRVGGVPSPAQPSFVQVKLPEVPEELMSFLKPVTFKNWARTVIVTVLEGRPRTVEDVVAIVNFARPRNLKVRAVGKTHSFTPIYSDPHQILLILDDLTLQGSESRMTFRRENMEVTFSAGVTVKKAREFMEENDIYFESLTVIQEVHMLGITPTASHGTGWNQKSISDWITKMKIVKSDGHIEEITDQDKLSAAAVSLGLFGVIVEQTMKVLSMQTVKVTNDFSKTFGEVFGPDSPYLPQLYKKDFSLEFFWFPFNSMNWDQIINLLVFGNTGDWDPNNDTVWIRRVEQFKWRKMVKEDSTKKLPEEKTSEEVMKQVFDEAYNLFGGAQSEAKQSGQASISLRSFKDHFVPCLSWLSFNTLIKPAFQAMNELYPEQHIDYAIHFVDPYLSPFRVYDFEMAFDCPADCTAVLQASRSVRDIVRREAQKGKFLLSGPFEMRFIGSTNCLLSPSVVSQNRSGHTAYVEMVPYGFTANYAQLFREVATEWIRIGTEVSCKPVPHWGKGFETIPNHHQYIREVYGINIEQFKAKRAEMNVDPNNMFVTEELKKIFQL